MTRRVALVQVEHSLDLEFQDEPRLFRARCSCGWVSAWETTNAVMGRGRRHASAYRRRGGK